MADATLDLATVWDQIRERLATSLSPQQNAMLNLTRPLGPRRGHGGAGRAQRVHPDRARVPDAPGARRGAVRAVRPRHPGRRPAGGRAGRAAGRRPRRGAHPPSLVRRRGAARRGGPGHPGPRRRRAQRVRRADRRRRDAAVGPPGHGRPATRCPAGPTPRHGSCARWTARPRRRPVDRGAPEDWSTQTWGTGSAEPAGGSRAGATGAGRTTTPPPTCCPSTSTFPPTSGAAASATAAAAAPRDAAARGAGRRRRVRRPPSGRPGPGSQPQVRVRQFRHRQQQPVRPCRGGRRRRGAGPRLQPAVHLRRVRPGQDPPAARDRALRGADVPQRARPVREHRGVHQRVHQPGALRPGRGVPPALPRHRLPADRRHPVPGARRADAGGVLPHLQHAAQRQQADRDHLRPRARRS